MISVYFHSITIYSVYHPDPIFQAGCNHIGVHECMIDLVRDMYSDNLRFRHVLNLDVNSFYYPVFVCRGI